MRGGEGNCLKSTTLSVRLHSDVSAATAAVVAVPVCPPVGTSQSSH